MAVLVIAGDRCMNAVPVCDSVLYCAFCKNLHKDNFHGRVCLLQSYRFQIRNCTRFWCNCVQLQFTPLEARALQFARTVIRNMAVTRTCDV